MGTSSVEIDAPGLRSFRYAGYARRFSLAASPPGMARADLHFFHDMYASASTLRDLFWRFLRSFRGVRSLKLKVSDLKHLLVAFPNVEHLELEGHHEPASEMAAAVAIGNLLRCCPAARHLTLRLATAPPRERDSAMNGSGRSFACLKNSLRRFAIQFRMDQPNCIDVKLIKFFAENAIHLEEMRID
uniref:FBD domain-containing protein n=1 Tax=Oryza rufipogon TaxID=4529 RepID=A0A0E0R9F1_ORYRU